MLKIELKYEFKGEISKDAKFLIVQEGIIGVLFRIILVT